MPAWYRCPLVCHPHAAARRRDRHQQPRCTCHSHPFRRIGSPGKSCQSRRNWVAEYRSRHHSAHFYAQLHRPKADPHFCSITPSDRACAPTLSNRVDRGNSRRHHSHHSHHRLPLPRRLRQHRRSRTRQIDARYDVLRPRTTSVSTAYR